MKIYRFFRPLIFKLDPELSHNLAIKFLKFFPNLATIFCLNRNYSNLHIKLWNIAFPNPIGMAAGFDKNAETTTALAKFGFGFIEVGTVTNKPQNGNDKPRIFRLIEDEAIINRLGFNNHGAEIFAKNISQIRDKNFVLGINIGKNKDTAEALSDYILLLEKFYTQASYITINISSPNTKNLRDLQKEDQLDAFLVGIMQKKNELKNLQKKNTPILLKVAPDLSTEEQETIAKTALKNQIDGIIISNTTISRDKNLKSKNTTESGGLSGKPLFSMSNEVLKNFYRFTAGTVPLIGVGGISSASDVYEKIKCGASLVQIYSALIYQGFGMVDDIKDELSKMVANDGFENFTTAIGIRTREPIKLIETERLILRSWHEDDTEAMAAINQDDRVVEFLPGKKTFAETKNFIARNNARIDDLGFGLWAVTLKSSGKLIGFTGLMPHNFGSNFKPCIEIGWRLSSKHWGQGYATEGAKAVMKLGFEYFKLPEIVSFTVPENLRSISVMKKLGMKRDLNGDFNHPSLEPEHRLSKHVLYRIKNSIKENS